MLGNAWGLSGPDLSLGGELAAADTRSFLIEHSTLVVACALAVVVVVQKRARLQSNTLAVVCMAGVVRWHRRFGVW